MTQSALPEIRTDGAGQRFVRFENVRITVSKRSGGNDWEETERYLTIRAYKDGESEKLNMGPDIPVRSDRSDDEILMAMYMTMRLAIG